MTIAQDITIMVARLANADIPKHHLCYLLDEDEWREFMQHIQSFPQFKERDLSYLEEYRFMGMTVMKRPSQRR